MRLSGSFLRGFFVRFAIALVTAGLLTGAGIIGVNLFIDQKLDDVPRVEIEAAPPPPEGANFLLIGSDSREGVEGEAVEAFGDPESEEAAGQRSDTMMVIHVEPEEQRTFLVSFPRDLLVDIDGDQEQINAAYGVGGPQKVIDVLEDNFQIPIHHYVEIGLLAFTDIVDAIGWVPVYLPGVVRDEKTGFEHGIYGPACYELDGTQALQYVRSRSMELYDPETGVWNSIDVQSDINRIQRQQYFIRSLAAFAVEKGLNNPLTANRVADGVLAHLKLDEDLTRDDLFGLLNAFRDVDPESNESFEMKTIPFQPYEADPNRLVVDEVAAEDVLARLRDFGGDEIPADVVPADVRVRVLNGSGLEGAAQETHDALQALGFATVDFGNADGVGATQILYATGLEGEAQFVQDYLGGVGQRMEDPSIVDADVIVVIGDDFGGVVDPSGEAETEPTESTDVPATDAPATDAPATEAPATEAPATEVPPIDDTEDLPEPVDCV